MRTARTCALTLTLALAFSFTAVSGPALAGKGNGNHKKQQQNDVGINLEVDVHYGKAVFTVKEQRIVREYFRTEHGNLPPGLAKKQSLPPGLQKQLHKTGHLPPGLEKRRIPSGLEARLPKYYGPYERTIVGNDLILLDPKTGLILDVMQEIFDLPVDATLEKAGARRVNY